MANLKISQLTELASADGSEYTEVIVSPYTSGTNRKVLTSQFIVTREFNRAFSETLLFDKNEIYVAQHVMTTDLTFVISPSGNLVDQTSSMNMEVVSDGISSINFTSTLGVPLSTFSTAGCSGSCVVG